MYLPLVSLPVFHMEELESNCQDHQLYNKYRYLNSECFQRDDGIDDIEMQNELDDALIKIGFMFCVSRGVDFGGNPISRKKSFNFSKEFMKKTLLK